MRKFSLSLLKNGFCAGLLALAFFPAMVRAEITASPDFPLPRVKKTSEATPTSQLLELYRQDVLTPKRVAKANTAGQSGTVFR